MYMHMNLRPLFSLKIFTALGFRNKKCLSVLYIELVLIATCDGLVVRIILVTVSTVYKIFPDSNRLFFCSCPTELHFLSWLFLFCCSDGSGDGDTFKDIEQLCIFCLLCAQPRGSRRDWVVWLFEGPCWRTVPFLRHHLPNIWLLSGLNCSSVAVCTGLRQEALRSQWTVTTLHFISPDLHRGHHSSGRCGEGRSAPCSWRADVHWWDSC